MTPFRMVTLLAVLLACRASPSAHAHGDVHERIQQLSAQITLTPGAADLLLQRANLYRQHGEFELSLADLELAAKLAADRRLLLLARARTYSDAGQTTNALRAADELLALQPDSAEVFALRARCRFKQQEVQGAIADFDAAIAHSAAPDPDLFLERARAQAALGRLAEAVAGLDAGLARLGAVPALQLAVIEMERQRGAFNDALARVERLAGKPPGAVTWLVLRAEILLQAGRLAEAKAGFQQVTEAIAGYPPARRELEMTRQLLARAQAGLTRATTRLATGPTP